MQRGGREVWTSVANGLHWCRQAQDAIGLQCRLWHRCNEGCIGMHMGPMCLRAHRAQAQLSIPGVLYFVLELGRNGYGYLGRYPLVKLLGSIVPFTGCHPISLLFIYELVD